MARQLRDHEKRIRKIRNNGSSRPRSESTRQLTSCISTGVDGGSGKPEPMSFRSHLHPLCF